MYPERRPYATAVNHAGYLSKPVLPPVEALRILSSVIGMDTPRSLRRGSASIVAESAAAKGGRPFSATKTLPTRGVSLFKPASLESASPFAFKEKDYHNSQQVALNAQLSHVVEKLFKTWHQQVTDLLRYLKTYPVQCASSNTQTVDAMDGFFQGYRATDVLPLTMEQLSRDFNLATSPEMLSAILQSPTVNPDRLRRTMDTLLNARHFLAPVEHYVQEMEPLAALALRDEPEKDSNDAPRGAVWLSRAAVALHEKFFFDPSEYALKELRKTDQPMERLEQRVLQTKEQKERAIDDELPGDALKFLTMQVDLSNDLLLMNKARLELVRLHSKDVRELRPLIDTIIEDARRSVRLLQGRIDQDLPRVKKDLESVLQDAQNTAQHIKYLTQVDEDARKTAHKAFQKLEGDESDLWKLLLETMQKLVDISNEKDAFAKKEMRLREQRSRDLTIALELMKTQQQYQDRLRSCEETLWRWSNVAEVYAAYVEAFVPKLLKKVHDAEEADKTLCNHEAQEYVRRHEMFEYAVEEGRATRQVHIDRLNTLHRSKEFDVERAEATLDPNIHKYMRDMQEAQEQLDEAKAYIDLLNDLEHERRSEVEPIVQRVILLNRELLQTEREEMARLMSASDGEVPAPDAAEGGVVEVNDMRETVAAPVREPERPAGAVVARESTTFSTASAGTHAGALRPRTGTTEVSTMATVAHPHTQARAVGINHEELFLEKYRRFADDEQRAVEGAAAKLRQTRNDLDRLGIKYDNADYAKMLLGSPGANHVGSGGVGGAVNAS